MTFREFNISKRSLIAVLLYFRKYTVILTDLFKENIFKYIACLLAELAHNKKVYYLFLYISN